MRRIATGLLMLMIFLGACTRGATTGAPSSPTQTPSITSAPSPSASPSESPTPSISTAACGDAGAGRTVTFRVAVDRTLPTTRTAFARTVRSILCGRRSWIASGEVRFRYDPKGALLIAVRTPNNTEKRCQQLIRLSVNRFYSCATHHEVVLNSARWFEGSPYWPGPLNEYRQMLTNHEVGHALGLRHQNCPTRGAHAPVMMQQSKGLTSPNGVRCRRNPWPRADELARLQ